MDLWRRLLFWVRSVVWRWLWFRGAAYYVFLVYGIASRSIVAWRELFWPGFILVFIVLAVWRLSPYCFMGTCGPDTFLKYINVPFLFEALAVYTILWLCASAYLTRRRIVVLESVNRAGEEFNSLTRGLSTEIISSLSELKELHSVKDASRRPSGKLIAPPIIRFDPGDSLSLAEIVGEKSSMKVLGVELQLRQLLRFFEWFLVPPTRLSIGIHRQGDLLIMVAGIDSEEQFWRVEQQFGPQAAEGDIASAFQKAREKLAYCIFVSLSSIESKEWEAVKEFSEGLRAYRRTLNTDIDKVLNLREAEEHFFKARSLDKYFARCGYNLGIVYKELDDIYNRYEYEYLPHRQASVACFMQTLNDDPQDIDAAYALAINCEEVGDIPKTIEFAQRTIAQMPTHAQAWNVKGHVLPQTHPEPDSREAWKSSLKSRELGAAFAWRDLCHAARTGRRELIEAAKRDIIAPFTNLADAYNNLGQDRRLGKVLRQAVRKNRDQNLYFWLGKSLLDRERFISAEREFTQAVNVARTLADRARYYAYIAEARTLKAKARRSIAGKLWPARANRDETFGPDFDFFKEALASPSSTDEDTRDVLSRALPDQSESVALVGQILEVLKREGPRNEVLKEDATKKKKRCKLIKLERCKLRSLKEDRFVHWARAVLDIEDADLLLSSRQRTTPQRSPEEDRREAIRLLNDAIEVLRYKFPAEARLRFAYERLAQALWQEREVDKMLIDKALIYAEMAVAQSPFSASASRQLGMVHYLSADYDRSEQELRKSFSLDPLNVETLSQIGELSRRRADISVTRDDRSAELQKAIQTFRQALSLGDEKTDRKSFLHHWLGRYYGDIGAYEKARKHYAIAKANKGFALESSFYSCWTAFEQENYPLAENFFREAFRVIIKEWNEHKIRVREWNQQGKKCTVRGFLRQSGGDTLTGSDETRGYIALRLGIFMAVIVSERYHNFERAKRLIRIVRKNMPVLGDMQAAKDNQDQHMLARLREKNKELEAIYNSYLGWICYRDGAHRDARKHIEKSLKIREEPETLCHLAWLDLEQGRQDRARERCKQVRQIDIRGWCEAKIRQIEARVEIESRAPE